MNRLDPPLVQARVCSLRLFEHDEGRSRNFLPITKKQASPGETVNQIQFEDVSRRTLAEAVHIAGRNSFAARTAWARLWSSISGGGLPGTQMNDKLRPPRNYRHSIVLEPVQLPTARLGPQASPLFEEEGNVPIFAQVPDFTNPVLFDRPSPRATLPSHDHPGNAR